MSDERLVDDADLKAAFRSVRDAYDGTHPEPDATLQRALFRTRTRERRGRATRWVVLPFAAVLVASTAWAGVTGKLPAAVASVATLFAEAPSRSAAAPAKAKRSAPAAATPATLEAPPVEGAGEEVAEEAGEATESADEVVAEGARAVLEPAAPTEPASEGALPETEAARVEAKADREAARASGAGARTSSVAAARGEPASDAPRPERAPEASAADPHADLFDEAHHLHFIARDPARALAAWDRYLASAPAGKFAPEARYNRALALVRLGRVAEAKRDLEAFASGAYGDYRRDEAEALLEALGRAAP